MDNIPERILSPTSINTYLNCPRKFYLRYIQRLKSRPTIHLIRGQIVHRFPDGDPTTTYGRGILAEGRIYWPTQSQLFVFEGKELAKTIDLVPLGLTGGNLTIVGKRLLITTDREITALE